MMKNVLVMQSGGCTPVLNKSLFGIVREADESKAFGKVYGAGFGLEGVLSGELLNLGKLSRAAWNRIARTPAAPCRRWRSMTSVTGSSSAATTRRKQGIA